MSTLQVAYNRLTKVALVQFKGGAVPAGSVKIGEFDHPDPVYPESLVIQHGVRDLLAVTSAADSTQRAIFPDNITDMSLITIQFAYPAALRLTTNLDTVRTASAGTDVTFPIVVTAGTSPYKYEWFYKQQYNSVWIKISPTANTTAATASLKVTAASLDSAGEYKAVVTDAMGNTVESYVAVLEVNAAAVPPALTSITATPASLALSVAADTAAGKTVNFAAVPTGALLGTLTIKTAPDAARATATINNGVLTVKPVAAGAATSVVVTNGAHDVTIAVTVAA